MARAPRQIGDKVVIVAVDGTTSPKPYELVPAQVNYSYTLDSEENIPAGTKISVPITFHGGMPEAHYDPLRSPGFWHGTGLITERPNVVYAPPIRTTVTLTNAAAPPMYFFEEPVDDAGADDGEYRNFIISVESAEVNIYKVSEDMDNFGTLLNTKTFTQTATQPMGQRAKWNNGSATEWYLPLGDNGKINKLTDIASGTSADTWSAGTNTADARLLQVVGNRLMRSTNENQVSLLPRAGDPTDETPWGDDFFVGDVSAQITALGEAGGLAYIAKENGFYEWDTVGEAVNIFPEIGFAPRNGQGMAYWHGGFVIPALSGLWWTRTGTPIGPDSNPNSLHLNQSLGLVATGRNGRWAGVYPFGKYLFAIWTADATNGLVLAGEERDPQVHPPGWGPVVWHVVDSYNTDNSNFQGLYMSERSEANPGSVLTYPYLWFAKSNDVIYQQRDLTGAPFISYASRSNLDSATTVAYASDMDFGLPRVKKQFRMVDGWCEGIDAVSPQEWKIFAYVDQNAAPGSLGTITADGYFQLFWTQDTNDTGHYLTLGLSWSGSGDLTNVDTPLLRDVRAHAVTLSNTAQVWTFNFLAEDKPSKTAKKIRSELEGYLQDLKQYELPDGDTFNGVMTSLRLLRADEIQDLKPANQPPPKYVLQAQVRQMVSS